MSKLKSVRPIEYQLVSLLGEGAFSTVYKALRRDLEFGLEQTVALKILKSKIEIEKWREEFASLECVRSERCVRVLGWDYMEDRPSLILEWIEGITLADWSDWQKSQKRTVQSLRQSLLLIDELCTQIYEGLKDLHASDNVHGDLSLQNVMITSQGTIKLLDFGLSQSKEINFTAEFVAPELLINGRATSKSDLYSLGRIREYLERQFKLPITQTTRSLLHHEPDQRQYICLFEASLEERTERQNVLANHLKAHLSHEKTQGPQKMQPQTQVIRHVTTKCRSKEWLKKLVYFSGIAFSLNAGNAAPDMRPAHLFIKTKYWAEISLDGRKIGYAPVDVELMPGRSYTIKWRTKTLNGQRSLTPEPGQNMVISDQFFVP
ncbi:MAG: protein kinase [Bdellovibrionota bacterium]